MPETHRASYSTPPCNLLWNLSRASALNLPWCFLWKSYGLTMRMHYYYFFISDEITASFRRFGHLFVDWPHKAESKSYFPPKGILNSLNSQLVHTMLFFFLFVCFFWQLTSVFLGKAMSDNLLQSISIHLSNLVLSSGCYLKHLSSLLRLFVCL